MLMSHSSSSPGGSSPLSGGSLSLSSHLYTHCLSGTARPILISTAGEDELKKTHSYIAQNHAESQLTARFSLVDLFLNIKLKELFLSNTMWLAVLRLDNSM